MLLWTESIYIPEHIYYLLLGAIVFVTVLKNICSLSPSLSIEAASGVEIQWCFSQVKGTIEDEVADGEEILFSSTVWAGKCYLQ